MAAPTSRQCPMMLRERAASIISRSAFADETPRPVPARHRPSRRVWLTLGIVGGIVGIAVATVVGFWPAISDAGRLGFGQLNPIWIIPAVLLVSVSMLSAALLQRRVLRAGGLALPVRSMIAIVVAGNAVSVTLPLAGSTAGTAFTYFQLKRRGADLPLAGWTLAVSGIISTSILALLLGLGASMTDDATTSLLGAAAIVVGVIPMVLLVASFRWPVVRVAAEQTAQRAIRAFQRVTNRGTRFDPTTVPRTIERVAGFRLGWRAGGSAAWLSVVNWTTDIACLAVCVAALGAPVPWTHLAIIYTAALGAASLSFTPAGIGIVETAVAVALMEFGTPAHQAIVAALMYRAISCWLVLALGWVSYAVLRRSAASVPTARVTAIQPAPAMPRPAA